MDESNLTGSDLDPGHRPSRPDRAAKARLLTFGELDQRYNATKNAKAMIETLTDDLGGNLSSAQRVLVQRAAIAHVMAEHLESLWLSGQDVDITTLNQLTNTIGRTLRTLGLERRGKDITPDLQSYIAGDAVPGTRTPGDDPQQPPRPPKPPKPKRTLAPGMGPQNLPHRRKHTGEPATGNAPAPATLPPPPPPPPGYVP